ncbi:MAG TPA: S41 family peptidase [Steroidobacteraceae bacterium]|jgi:carboxyl-terminal processing protease|nr:S41 family peptidase [Steroidobacteraceae bacterium]
MLMRSRTLTTLITGVIVGFGAAATSGVLADRPPEDSHRDGARSAAHGLPWEEASLFAEVYERIKREYVDEVDDHALMEKAVRGMVAALDPHSAYLDSEEFDEIRVSTMGSYPGVGIEVAPGDGVVRILRPIEGSPAQQAGLLAGDEIVRIDGVDIGADLAGAIAHMRGTSGSLVRLTIRRAGAPGLREYTLRRAEVEVHSVAQQTLEPGYGYLRITSFSETTAQDVGRAVSRLKRDNPGGLKGLLLDLRNNPGGVLEAGVAVADDFLESGVIVTADGRTPEARFRMDATPGDLIEGAPLVVLVNGGSASASEIVAAALKDHGRALLVGRRTYGKGSVQTVMPLSHGGAVKLTTSRYFTPSGASIQGKGIVPDILEGGPGEAPAELLVVRGSPPLVERDTDVRLGLEALKSRAREPRGATPLVTRALVP